MPEKPRHVTLLWVPDSLRPSASLRIPYWFLKTLAVAIAVVLAGTVGFAHHYQRLASEKAQLQVWKTVGQEQTAELARLQMEVQALESRVAQLQMQADALQSQLRATATGAVAHQAASQGPPALPRAQTAYPPPALGGPVDELSRRVSQLSAAADRLQQQYQDLAGLLKDVQEEARRYPDRWPVSGAISSPFGLRRDPFTRTLQFHSGIDIAAPYGSPVTAAAAGTVTFAGYKPGYGFTVIVRHSTHRETLYAHMSRILVTAGQAVEKGDVIGRVGSSGHSTGPHLHFEVLEGGRPVDPYPYLTGQRYAFLAGTP